MQHGRAGMICRDSISVSAARATVAQLPVKNRPETGSTPSRPFSTPAGWFFARAKHASCCWLRVAKCTALACPHAEEPRLKRVHARPTLRNGFRMRAPQDEDERRINHSSRFQTAHLVPAARFLRPGFCILASLTSMRVGGAPRDVRVLGGTPVRRAISRHARRLARRLASHDAGRSPLGAPPWRFWAPDRKTSRNARPARPEPPGASGYEPPPQDATPRSAFGIVSRTRPQ